MPAGLLMTGAPAPVTYHRNTPGWPPAGAAVEDAVLDGADVVRVARPELERAVPRDVVGRGDARAEGAVVGRHDAEAVRRVVLVVPDAEVERQPVVQPPGVVQERRVRQGVRALGQGEDRRVVDVGRRADDREDVAVREDRVRREEPVVAARLVVVRDARAGEVVVAEDDVVRAERARRQEVRALDLEVLVVALLRVAHAAERGRVVPGVSEGPVPHERALDEVGEQRARVLERELPLRVEALDEEIAREDAVVVRRDDLLGKLPGDEAGRVQDDAEEVVDLRVVDMQVGSRQGVVRDGRQGQLALVALLGLGLLEGDGRDARRRGGLARDARVLIAARAEEPDVVLPEGSAEGRLVARADLLDARFEGRRPRRPLVVRERRPEGARRRCCRPTS